MQLTQSAANPRIDSASSASFSAPVPAGPPPLPVPGEVIGPPPKRGGDLGWLPLGAAAFCVVCGVFLWHFLLSDNTPLPTHVPTAVTGINRALPANLNVDLAHPQWPPGFEQGQTAQNGPPRLSGSLLSRQVVGDMTKTYGSYTDQLQKVRLLGLRFTDLRGDLLSAENKFDRNYRKSVDQIDWTLTDWSPAKWSNIRKEVQSAAQQTDVSRMNVTQAEQFLKEVRQRAAGRMAEPQFEILLAFNPEYVANPATEMEDGFTQEYQGDGSGAAHGLIVRMKYPRSWMATTPTGGRTVRLLRDRRSALNVASVRVDDLPNPSIHNTRDLVELFALSDIRDVSPDAKLTAGGIVPLPNLKDALWREFRFTRAIQGRAYKMKAVDFAVVKADQCVSIGFTVAMMGTASDADLDTTYARYCPLFRTILSSVQVE